VCSGPFQKDKAILALTNRVAENLGDPTIIARMTAHKLQGVPNSSPTLFGVRWNIIQQFSPVRNEPFQSLSQIHPLPW